MKKITTLRYRIHTRTTFSAFSRMSASQFTRSQRFSYFHPRAHTAASRHLTFVTTHCQSCFHSHHPQWQQTPPPLYLCHFFSVRIHSELKVHTVHGTVSRASYSHFGHYLTFGLSVYKTAQVPTFDWSVESNWSYWIAFLTQQAITALNESPEYDLLFICCFSFSVTEPNVCSLLSLPWASHQLSHFFHPIENTDAFITPQVCCTLRQCLFTTEPPNFQPASLLEQSFPLVSVWLSVICTRFKNAVNDERNVVGWCRQGLMRIYFI